MIRVLEAEPIAVFPEESDKMLVEIAGLSTDEKPTSNSYATGSSFMEVDTGNVYLYDETSPGAWHKVGGGNNG